MAITFQIEEMIHQDVDGVIFRARDSENGRPLAVRRFFLPEAQIGRLRSEEDGSLFSKGLHDLRDLQSPHVRKVMDGGFDDTDGTPYLVLEWIERETLREAREKGWLGGEDRAVFEAQIRSTLAELPREMANALLLESDEIIVSRNAGGELDCSFLISPRHYFGALGGSPARSTDHEQSIAGLAALFPKESSGQPKVAFASSSPERTPAPAPAEAPRADLPKLKSAEGRSGAGVKWAFGILLLAICGVAIWSFLKAGSRGGEEEKEWIVATDKSGEEPVVEEASEDEDLPTETAAEPQVIEELDEAPAEAADEIAIIPEEEETVDVSEENEREQEIAAEEIFEEEPAPEVVIPEEVAPPEPTVVETEDVVEPAEQAPEPPPVFDPYDLEGLRAKAGEVVTLKAPVMAVERSGGQGTLWYLDFGNTTRTAFVYFKHVDAADPGTWEEWQKFYDQDVEVTGVVDLDRSRRGSGVALVVESPEAVEVVLPPRVYQYSEWRELEEPAGKGEDVLFEARYQDFLKREETVYLLFEEGVKVAARFLVGGPLSNQSFLSQMKKLEGQKVRLSAPVVHDPQGQIEYVFELDEPGDFQAAPAASGGQ